MFEQRGGQHKDYTWDEIERSWLGGPGQLRIAEGELVRLFNVVAARFGRDWMEGTRRDANRESVTQGTAPTLFIATMGQLLGSLNGVKNSDKLVDRVRKRNNPARAELVAIHLVRSGAPDVLLEVEPRVVVGNREKAPDFRVRRSGEDWVYVEVTQPSESREHIGIQRDLARLTDLVHSLQGGYSVEVFLKREPSRDELETITSEITRGHCDKRAREIGLEDNLGTLYWNVGSPKSLKFDDHGERYMPRLCRVGFVMGGDEAECRYIAVRWPFTDERAHEFLRNESKQLPKDAPGLIMINPSGAPGAMRAWRGLLEKRFQPNMYTRVSAVCLFTSNQVHTEGGNEWRMETKLVVNPYALFRLPTWLVHQLERFPSRLTDI